MAASLSLRTNIVDTQNTSPTTRPFCHLVVGCHLHQLSKILAFVLIGIRTCDSNRPESSWLAPFMGLKGAGRSDVWWGSRGCQQKAVHNCATAYHHLRIHSRRHSSLQKARDKVRKIEVVGGWGWGKLKSCEKYPLHVSPYRTDHDFIRTSLSSNYRHFGRVFAPSLLLLVRVSVKKKVFGRDGKGY